MADNSSRTQIILALIAVSGVVATAVAPNWDKIFPPRPAPVAASTPPPAPAAAKSESAPIDPAPNQAVPSRPIAPQQATNPPDKTANASAGAGEADPPKIAGDWLDEDGTFRFSQTGAAYRYIYTKNGIQLSSGAGRFTGRTFKHSYSQSDGSTGECQGTADYLGRIMTGTCTDAEVGASWSFTLQR
jgi:hypothetical protein